MDVTITGDGTGRETGSRAKVSGNGQAVVAVKRMGKVVRRRGTDKPSKLFVL